MEVLQQFQMASLMEILKLGILAMHLFLLTILKNQNHTRMPVIHIFRIRFSFKKQNFIGRDIRFTDLDLI